MEFQKIIRAASVLGCCFALVLGCFAARGRDSEVEPSGEATTSLPLVQTLQTQLLFATPAMRFQVEDSSLSKDLSQAALQAYKMVGKDGGGTRSRDSSSTGANEVFWQAQTSKKPHRAVLAFRKTPAFKKVRNALVEAAAGMLEALGRVEGADELVGSSMLFTSLSSARTFVDSFFLPILLRRLIIAFAATSMLAPPWER